MSVMSLKAEQALKPECLRQYNELHNDIWHRLCRIDVSLFALQHITAFPFALFLSPTEMFFWTMVYWNFHDMVVVLLHGLLNDTKNAITLRWFKNRLAREWIRPELKTEYFEHLRTKPFDQETRDLQERVGDLRNAVVAHALFESQTCVPVGVPGVPGVELLRLFEAAKKLFDACTFGGTHFTRPPQYGLSTVGGQPTPSDIEQLLDLVAKNSAFVNQPEHDGVYWPELRKRMAKERLEQLNKWRAKFGMPEV